MSIRIDVDAANPGQFFACCGLLELADRLWGGAEGAFSSSGVEFLLSPGSSAIKSDADELRSMLASCDITSTMSDEQVSRLKRLLNQEKSSLSSEQMAEKQRLSKLWEEERLCLHEPFHLWIDWWRDEYAGGTNFKTWAGKQFVIDLVRGMQTQIRSDVWSSLPSTGWLNNSMKDGSLPLYFDSDTGGQSSSLDVGFSLDTLSMRSCTRPMIELGTFVGLQRFRPAPKNNGESFTYMLWTEPLPPILAAAACCGSIPQRIGRVFSFRMLYRSKYLKSFLTANPIRRLGNE